jgi:putative molybdopterin biosynthesis protein
VGARILRVATWEEGLAVRPDVSTKSVQSVLKARLTWIGREPGSGARLCMDELVGNKVAPRRVAFAHRGVADSIRAGRADVGVCHRLTTEEAGLRFLPVRNEAYDLCFRAEDASDPRIEALVRVVQSASYRRILAELPGFSCRETGSVATV